MSWVTYFRGYIRGLNALSFRHALLLSSAIFMLIFFLQLFTLPIILTASSRPTATKNLLEGSCVAGGNSRRLREGRRTVGGNSWEGVTGSHQEPTEKQAKDSSGFACMKMNGRAIASIVGVGWES